MAQDDPKVLQGTMHRAGLRYQYHGQEADDQWAASVANAIKELWRMCQPWCFPEFWYRLWYIEKKWEKHTYVIRLYVYIYIYTYRHRIQWIMLISLQYHKDVIELVNWFMAGFNINIKSVTSEDMDAPVCLLGVRALVKECPRLRLSQKLQAVSRAQPSVWILRSWGKQWSMDFWWFGYIWMVFCFHVVIFFWKINVLHSKIPFLQQANVSSHS